MSEAQHGKRESPGREAVSITPNLLREWPLPAVGDSKYARGQLVVVGGAARSPGAAMLSGLAALRVGAGRLTLAVGRSIAPAVAVAVPECGVVPLAETEDEHVAGAALADAAEDLAQADAVLVGPGLDDADEAERMLRLLPDVLSADAVLLLDAYALGVVARVPEIAEAFGGRLVLTPNRGEAGRLLEREFEHPDRDLAEIAARYSAVVSCYGRIADTEGNCWNASTGSVGLGTSGSGDVLAGAIAGLCARGADPAQATVWATHAHGAAGDRLAVQVGALGYLASELLAELPRVLVELGA